MPAQPGSQAAGARKAYFYGLLGKARGAGFDGECGFSGVAGVREGSAVVGATCVAVTAGDWVWTAFAAAPSHVFTPRWLLHASERSLTDE